MIKNKNTNTMNYNPQILKTNINPVDDNLFNNKNKTFNSLKNSQTRGCIPQNLKQNIDRLNLSSLNLNFISTSKEVIKNSIKNKNLIKLENKNNLNQEVNQPLSFNNTSLTFASLLKDIKATTSNFKVLNNNITTMPNLTNKLDADGKLETQIKLIPNPKMENLGLFMSLNSYSDYYFHLKNAINSIKSKKGKVLIAANQTSNNELINENDKLISYKIRHYLNLISKFNFKLSTSYYHLFQFKKSNKYFFKMEKAAEILRLAFLAKGCLISKPKFNIVYQNVFNENDEIDFSNKKNLIKPKIVIHLFYFVKTKGLVNNFNSSGKNFLRFNGSSLSGHNKIILNKFNDKFNFLCDYLTKLFNADIELELVRLYRPYLDSNILVQYLNSKSYNYKFIRLTSRLFRKIKIYRKKNRFNKPSVLGINNPLKTILLNELIAFPSGISGIYIKLAGRPYKERIVPRFTVKQAHRGNFDKLNAKMIEQSMFTDKTKKGAFNFTVRLNHIFR